MRFIILVFLTIHSNAFSSSPNSFSIAKKIAAEMFQVNPHTIYCHCTYILKKVDLSSCNMQSAKNIKRASRVEWEHIQAAEHFGKHFECWRTPMCIDKNGKSYKGRKCCQKIDDEYRHVESELYNLWPEVGMINQARSNYRFGMLLQTKDYYGCSIAIDKSSKKVEPSDASKGVIARAYLFMAEHYNLPLSKSQRQLFEAWNREYAPSSWEQKWAKKISFIEGYENTYISNWGQHNLVLN